MDIPTNTSWKTYLESLDYNKHHDTTNESAQK